MINLHGWYDYQIKIDNLYVDEKKDLFKLLNLSTGYRFKINTTSKFTSFKEEFKKLLLELDKTYNINLLFSGGGDSFLVAVACLEYDININHTIFDWKDKNQSMNSIETDVAIDFCIKNNRKFYIKTIDIEEFWKNWLTNTKFSEYTSVQIEYLFQIYMATFLSKSQYNIIGTGEPSLILTEHGWLVSDSSDGLNWDTIFEQENILGCTRILQATPEVGSSLWFGKEIQNIILNNCYDSKIGDDLNHTFKYEFYSDLGFDIMQYKRPKNTIQNYKAGENIKKYSKNKQNGNLKPNKNYFSIKSKWIDLYNNLNKDYWISSNE